MNDRTALYRFYDADGALLYVGITYDIGIRFHNHSRKKEWWPAATDLTVKWYETRDLAMAAEREAIKTESPVWNIQHARPQLIAMLDTDPLAGMACEVFTAVCNDLNAVEDPAKRIRLTTEALEAAKEFNAEVSQLRQAAAKELKDQGLTLARIGELAGPPDKPLHFSRIRQILQGGPTGRWAKAAREAADETPPAGE